MTRSQGTTSSNTDAVGQCSKSSSRTSGTDGLPVPTVNRCMEPGVGSTSLSGVAGPAAPPDLQPGASRYLEDRWRMGAFFGVPHDLRPDLDKLPRVLVDPHVSPGATHAEKR